MLIEILPDFWLLYSQVQGIKVDGKIVTVYVENGGEVEHVTAKFESGANASAWAEELRDKVNARHCRNGRT